MSKRESTDVYSTVKKTNESKFPPLPPGSFYHRLSSVGRGKSFTSDRRMEIRLHKLLKPKGSEEVTEPAQDMVK